MTKRWAAYVEIRRVELRRSCRAKARRYMRRYVRGYLRGYMRGGKAGLVEATGTQLVSDLALGAATFPGGCAYLKMGRVGSTEWRLCHDLPKLQ